MNRPFNPSQSEAISHKQGPAMVLAGPGSGKTLVITHRVYNLIHSYNVKPENILVITFTKAASIEMRDRYRALSGVQDAVTFGTFHSVFFRILKYAYQYKAEDVIRSEEVYRVISELAISAELTVEDEELLSNLIGEIGRVKNEGIDITHYYPQNCSADVFRRIFEGYQQYLHQHRKLDFDDMLVYTYELFQERPDILAMWQKQYAYILIDEYQDINKLQFEIVRMLAAPQNNLFVVGDDDQSIYGFRGSKPELMLRFGKYYPQAHILYLRENYRSTAAIVEASGRLISHNQSRYKKDFLAVSDEKEAVIHKQFKNQKEEYEEVIRHIKEAYAHGIPYHEMAILCRTNLQPRKLIYHLINHNIPFASKDVIPNIYEHWITKDILAYIRIAQGSRERKDFLRIMNRPGRYIKRESLEQPSVDFDRWCAYYKEQPQIAQRIRKLEEDIRVLSGMTPYSAVNYIRKAMNYDEYLKQYAEYRKVDEDELYALMEELQDSAREYKRYDAWICHMQEYKEDLIKQTKQEDYQSEGVWIVTLHGAKGLEYEEVYLIDVNEGVMPYKKAVLNHDVEEERRMFYVGMTRAKSKLRIYSVEEYNGKAVAVSRFVKEALSPA